MITVRRSEDRGHAEHGWLDARHTFSFAGYRDRNHMGFRTLRVMNEDRIAPGGGFPTHDHKDMEIITYVLSGAVRHEDSTGGGGVIRPGEVQYMCAGRGVSHSEFNASDDDPLHLYQIWILPDAPGHEPGYAQRSFGDERNGVLRLVASPDGRDESIAINQDAFMYAGLFEEGAEIKHELQPARYGWLQVARGEVEIGGEILQAGDGAKIENETTISLRARSPSELLFFDLA